MRLKGSRFKVHGFTGSGVHGFRGSGLRGSGVQGLKEVEGFKGVQGFSIVGKPCLILLPRAAAKQ
jgi:hypothetical protein